MIDPVGSFNDIRNNFLLYVKTAFSTRYPSFEAEREELLKQPGILCQEPWVEPLPKYKSSGKSADSLISGDLPGLSEQEAQEFKSLISKGLVGEYKFYKHQLDMLKYALHDKNCIITAGTGSGKTESFLLPLFASLIRESSSWQNPIIHTPLKTVGGNTMHICLNGRETLDVTEILAAYPRETMKSVNLQ